jgi:hypothetical protein
VATKAAKVVSDAAQAVGEVVREVAVQAGLIETHVFNLPATARKTTVRVEQETDTNKGQWYIAAGLGGTDVPVVAVTYRPPGANKDATLWMWDGDGEATTKFLKNSGDYSFPHREVHGTEV